MFNNIRHPAGPDFAKGVPLITDNAGYPSRTPRTGIRANNRSSGVTLWSDSSPNANGAAPASRCK